MRIKVRIRRWNSLWQNQRTVVKAAVLNGSSYGTSGVPFSNHDGWPMVVTNRERKRCTIEQRKYHVNPRATVRLVMGRLQDSLLPFPLKSINDLEVEISSPRSRVFSEPNVGLLSKPLLH